VSGGDERPWWSSGSDGRVDPGPAAEDPLGTAGPAGNGRRGDSGTGAGWSDDPQDAAGGTGRDHGAPWEDGIGGERGQPGAHGPDVCRACPVCTFLRMVGDARPEVVTHLMEAARHLTLAAKAAVDGQATRFDGTGGFQRIDLDDD
jgi:hypothetical protein